ncbi:uncharacterized protein RSE6_12669 [Rhynchosporium secalis]|uniref:Uncharacterized protein n=1 Tax=Rhynchosporium secalis TaxID=38038 RepID=A0A1E1MR01_RHYSE|nr:uncharacterized protein RSE6_12669 [Rhynchosporium secalis]
MTAAEQVAFGRALEEYYHKFENWETECYEISKRYEWDIHMYSHEYIGYCEEIASAIESEGPLPYFPEEPAYPPKPEIPVPPSKAPRTLINTEKKKKKNKNRSDRKVSDKSAEGHRQRLAKLVAETVAIDPIRVTNDGISKEKPAKHSTSNACRAIAVERALRSLEVKVISNSTASLRTGGGLEKQSETTFSNLSMRPKFKATKKRLLGVGETSESYTASTDLGMEDGSGGLRKLHLGENKLA